MPLHDDEISLRHMLDHALEAVDLVKNKKREDLDKERVLNLSLVRLMEIVGEAANRVSQTTKNKTPGIPWAQIISLRNRLIHGYDEVDFDVLWGILRKDMPPLIESLKKINQAD